jgi:hypothetical protein
VQGRPAGCGRHRTRGFLVALARQPVIGTLVPQRLRRLPWRVPGVERHRAAFPREQRQKGAYRRDLVTLGLRCQRSQAQPAFGGESADPGQRRPSRRPVRRTPPGLTVQGDRPAANRSQLFEVSLKTSGKARRVQPPEDPAEGGVRRRAMLQIEKLAQPLFFGLGKRRHRHAAFRPAQTSTEGNRQHIQPLVLPCMRTTRVGQTRKG